MAENNTIIVVGKTEKDQYGNLLVTPAGGGTQIKIGNKRSQLFDLFQQGKAVMLEWQTYMDKPYVANAKLVEGELPPATKQVDKPKPIEEAKPTFQETRSQITENMFWGHLKDWLLLKEGEKGADPFWKQLRAIYFAKMLSVLDIKIEKVKN